MTRSSSGEKTAHFFSPYSLLSPQGGHAKRERRGIAYPASAPFYCLLFFFRPLPFLFHRGRLKSPKFPIKLFHPTPLDPVGHAHRRIDANHQHSEKDGDDQDPVFPRQRGCQFRQKTHSPLIGLPSLAYHSPSVYTNRNGLRLVSPFFSKRSVIFLKAHPCEGKPVAIEVRQDLAVPPGNKKPTPARVSAKLPHPAERPPLIRQTPGSPPRCQSPPR